MATERPEDQESDKDEAPVDKQDERPNEDAATVEEQSEQSFPASDPPSY